jgi:hypothetical protein
MGATPGAATLYGRVSLLRGVPPDGTGRSALLTRVEPPSLGAALFAPALFVDMATGLPLSWQRRPFAVALTRALAETQGWWMEEPVPPGRYFLRLQHLIASGAGAGGPLDFTIRVPEDAPPAVYVGTFRLGCGLAIGEGGRPDCTLARAPRDESEAARAMVVSLSPTLPAPGAALARPYPPRLAGWPPPLAPEIRIDARSIAAALPPPPRGAPAPAGALVPSRDADPPTYVSVSGGDFRAGGDAVGAVIAPVVVVGGGVGAAAVVLFVLVPIAAVIDAIVTGPERERRLAAEREVRERLAPCLGRAAEVLAPAELDRSLGTAVVAQLPPPPPRSVRSPVWQATVTRVLLRSCAGPGETAGVEVATRWTIPVTEPGEEPAEIYFNRGVAGAVSHPGLAFTFRPYWEMPLRDAACRPITDFCGPAGEALLLQEVARGVTEARDAIAAAR